MQCTLLKRGLVSVRRERVREKAPSAPMSISVSREEEEVGEVVLWVKAHVQVEEEGETERSLWSHFMFSDGMEDRRRDERSFRAISGLEPPGPPWLPSSEY